MNTNQHIENGKKCSHPHIYIQTNNKTDIMVIINAYEYIHGDFQGISKTNEQHDAHSPRVTHAEEHSSQTSHTREHLLSNVKSVYIFLPRHYQLKGRDV